MVLLAVALELLFGSTNRTNRQVRWDPETEGLSVIKSTISEPFFPFIATFF